MSVGRAVPGAVRVISRRAGPPASTSTPGSAALAWLSAALTGKESGQSMTRSPVQGSSVGSPKTRRRVPAAASGTFNLGAADSSEVSSWAWAGVLETGFPAVSAAAGLRPAVEQPTFWRPEVCSPWHVELAWCSGAALHVKAKGVGVACDFVGVAVWGTNP